MKLLDLVEFSMSIFPMESEAKKVENCTLWNDILLFAVHHLSEVDGDKGKTTGQ